MKALTDPQIARVAANLDFSGTLTVGLEIAPVMATLLGRPVRTPEDYLQAACVAAGRYGFAALACWPFQLAWARKHLPAGRTRKQMVVNFPYGTLPVELALREMKWGLDRGAEEIDSVVPIQFLQAEDYAAVAKYVRALQEAARPYGVEVKSIIRVGDLLKSEDEVASLRKVQGAARAVVDGGGSFVKTCTGWEDGRATVRLIRAIREVTAGTGTKVKASGGVTCIEDAVVLMDAGADRVAGRWPIVLQLRQLGWQAGSAHARTGRVRGAAP